MFRFEELNIYNDASAFASWIYKITSDWPKKEIYGLTDQLRRAAVSISLNIAEGTSRGKVEFGHFLDMARGSCYECVAIGKIGLDASYVDAKTYSDMYNKCEILARMISSLKKSLNS